MKDPLLEIGTKVKKTVITKEGTALGEYLIIGKRFINDGKAFDYGGVSINSEGIKNNCGDENIISFNHMDIEEIIENAPSQQSK